jgi:hypothetical protein
MQILRRKGWLYTALIVWLVAAVGVQLSALKRWPIFQASGENTLNAAEEAYCQRPEVRNKALFTGEFVLFAGENKWLCKQVIRQHNRDFAIALFWALGPPALVLLAVWFPPSFSRRHP